MRSLKAIPSFAAVLLLTSACIAFYQPPAGTGSEKPAAAAASQEKTIKGDANKKYVLTKPAGTAPASGHKLLIVLPGGDGSAEFKPFVTNLAKQATPGYIVAQAVAPQWSTSEERVVWPTAKSKDPKAKFTTEEFIEAIIADVKASNTIDERCVFLLGWSSGGPPSYAMTLKQGSPVTGAFVAMSVFKPEQLPSLENSKGKAFYILHSPTDFINMSFPEAARDKLAAKGAKTKLATYEGGHGWHGDAFGQVREGLTWLEANAVKPKKD